MEAGKVRPANLTKRMVKQIGKRGAEARGKKRALKRALNKSAKRKRKREDSGTRSLFDSWGNRVTIAASALWLVYVAGAQPCKFAPSYFYSSNLHWYEKPFFLFVAFGERVAGAVGVYSQDCGAVQVLSGLLALIACVRLACWVTLLKRR
ncbi:MAG: hypothetical protein WB992_01945 [Bryobacteraceae bacterium]